MIRQVIPKLGTIVFLLFVTTTAEAAGKRLKVAIVVVNQLISASATCTYRAYLESHAVQKDWDISFVDFPTDEIEAAKVAKNLIKTSAPDVVLGDHTSQHALALARVFNALKTPYITTSTTLPAITQGHPYVVRYSTDALFDSRQISKFVNRHIKAKSAAIIIDVSKPYSTGYGKSFTEFVRKEIPEIKLTTYELISADKSIHTIFNKVHADKPDIIYAPVYAFEGVQVIKGLDDLKSTIPLILHSATLGSKTPPQKNFAIYFMGGTDPNVDSTKYAEYENAIANSCKGPNTINPKGNLITSSAWDTISLLHSITKNNPGARGLQIIKAFNYRPHQGIGGLRTVDKDGSVSQSTFFFELKNGVSKYITTIDN